MKIEVLHFNQLSAVQLYDLLKLRQDVFVLEQTCLYHDIDDKDINCYHALGYCDRQLIAYARIIPKGLTFNEASLGRVVTTSIERGKGYGFKLMQHVLMYMDEILKEPVIRISAQAYLVDFYQSLGFKITSEVYLEDDIPHIEMIR